MADGYALGMYEKALPGGLAWEERLALARESGFDFVEISIDETDERLARLDWDGAQRLRLVEASRRAGVPIGSMCLSAHRRYPFGAGSAQDRARALEIMDAALGLASDLGVRIIQLAGYDVYYEEGTPDSRRRFEEGLARAVDMAARRGVVLGLETMETPFMDTVGKAMAHVERISSPYLGVYPDIGNLTNASLAYGVPVADDIALGRGHIFAAHCKETVTGRYREVPYGSGTTDYAGALGELAAQGVRRFVAEFWYTGAPEWRRDAREACAFVRNRIEGALARAAGPHGEDGGDHGVR